MLKYFQHDVSGTARYSDALAIGILSNTLLKFGIALSIGRGRFRNVVAVGLIVIMVTTVAAIFLSRS